MITRPGNGKWLSGFLLLLLLLPGCRPAGGSLLEEALAADIDVREIEIVQQIEQQGRQLVLFYYTDVEGQRWLATGEVWQTENGSWEMTRRYSSLQVNDSCASPCTTFDVEQDPGTQTLLLYGYSQHPDTAAVAIELSDGRVLTRSVTERAFIATWSGPGTGPGDPGALHQEIREINE